jgi:imidazolonepropionase-like amidohydrolase
MKMKAILSILNRSSLIAEGAYADILVIDGNPMEDINVMADPLNNFKIIMKDGKVYKNEL